MKTIEEMLPQLLRADVAEFAVASDRLPCVKVGSDFVPLDDVETSTDAILQMLVSVGGSRHVDSLGPSPVVWSAQVEGVGAVAVSALMRGDLVQARMRLTKRDPRAEVPEPAVPSSRSRPGAPPLEPRRSAPRPPPAPVSVSNLRARPPAEIALELDPPLALDLDSIRDPPHGDDVPAESTLHDGVSPIAIAPLIEEALESTRSPPSRSIESFHDLLALARDAHASDVHVVPERPPLLRVAGELRPEGVVLDASFVARIVRKVVPERLAPVLEADGSCDFAVADDHGRVRVNVVRQRTGYKITARLISAEVPTLESLGLPAAIGKATHHHQGLILVTGPTGHGKTSTLAGIVDLINRETTHHVITVEDPVEYVHPRKRAMMSQREIGTHTKSFANALKASLREDPDVIVVGELRDTETVRMALAASETGHLVIGTMNTPSAAKTIDRVIDLFPPGDQAQVRLTLAGGLRLIVSQRLIPNVTRDGLVAACEILPGSISLWSLIRDNKTFQIPSLQQRGKGLGIVRFDDSLAELVKAGRIALDVAKQWAESPEELELTALNKRPVVQNPGAPRAGYPSGATEAAKPALGGIFDKAGNIFRKGP